MWLPHATSRVVPYSDRLREGPRPVLLDCVPVLHYLWCREIMIQRLCRSGRRTKLPVTCMLLFYGSSQSRMSRFGPEWQLRSITLLPVLSRSFSFPSIGKLLQFPSQHVDMCFGWRDIHSDSRIHSVALVVGEPTALHETTLFMNQLVVSGIATGRGPPGTYATRNDPKQVNLLSIDPRMASTISTAARQGCGEDGPERTRLSIRRA